MLPAIPSFDVGQLAAMPSTALASIANSQAALMSGINAKAAGLKKRTEKLSGTATSYLPTQGRVPFESTVSADKIEASTAAAIGPIIGTSNIISASVDMGEDVLTNAEDAGTSNILAKEMATALKGFIQETLPDGSEASPALELASLQAGLASFAAGASTITSNLSAIKSVLEMRASGEIEEPKLKLDHLITVEDPSIDKMVEDFNTYVEDNIVHPYEENIKNFGTLAQITQLKFKEDPPMFDFTYGPPVTKAGIFILSEDGLYYDSITGGIPEVEGVKIASEHWNLKYAPNLGGKGKTYSNDNLTNVSKNVFESYHMAGNDDENEFYTSDEVLRLIDTNKQLHIDLVQDQLVELRAAGLNEDSAIMVNHLNNIGAITSMYAERSAKRKKQLQLISIFAKDLYSHTEIGHEYKDLSLGNGVLIYNEGSTLSPNWHPVERVPINDFSFLKGTGAGTTLEQQESILMFSEDLDDTVLPITPNFSRPEVQPYSYLSNFTLSPIEEGVFPYAAGDPGVSAISNTVLSISNTTLQSGLVLNYNFLDPNVTTALSTEFTVVDEGPNNFGPLNGQLVASSTASVFPSGLSIPKLTGTNGGSYVRLPNNYTVDGVAQPFNTQEINDLFYPPNLTYDSASQKGGGVTFDFWVHMPNFTMSTSHRYRLVAACENSGGNSTAGPEQSRIDATRTDLNGVYDATKVHGMIMGFRDRGGTAGAGTSGLEFGIWPTVSQNKNDGSFGHSVCIAEHVYRTELGVTLLSSIELEGVSITDASGAFIHMAVVFDFELNSVNFYVDGILLKSAILDQAFDLQHSPTIGIPSITEKPGTLGTHTTSWEDTAGVGPNVGSLGNAFTPWILGGGFSDSIPRETGIGTYDPGFLGYNTNSYYQGPPHSQHIPSLGSVNPPPSSGLDGFLGSFKLYSKALSINEVRSNFKAQKGFFKNIKIS